MDKFVTTGEDKFVVMQCRLFGLELGVKMVRLKPIFFPSSSPISNMAMKLINLREPHVSVSNKSSPHHMFPWKEFKPFHTGILHTAHLVGERIAVSENGIHSNHSVRHVHQCKFMQM
jgi:hypothetical protein